MSTIKDDVRDFAEGNRRKADSKKSGETFSPPEPWRPFPVEVFPRPLDDFVRQGAIALGCDHAYIALPLLAALGSAVGNTRRVRLKRTWDEPAVVWSAVVGDSGSIKSPANDLALDPVRRRQELAIKKHETELAAHEVELLSYDRDLHHWRKSKSGGAPPTKPERPSCERFMVSDITVEALADRLRCSPRGLLLVRDELAGWFKGFGQYKSGRGGDTEHFLTMHGARNLLVDRKTGDKATLYIPHAAVSITGGIQPETLRAVLGREHFANGLAARFLFAKPTPPKRRWSEVEVHPELLEEVGATFAGLYGMPPGTDGDETFPIAVGLSRDAKAAWVEFFNRHGAEHDELIGDLAAAWSKLEGYAARLALIICFARWAGQKPLPPEPTYIGLADIQAGTQLSEWFGYEARRLYLILNETDDARDIRELIELIRRKGGRVAPRDLMRCSRSYPTAGLAEEALERLVKMGKGTWEPTGTGPTGGRPGRVFNLADTVDS